MRACSRSRLGTRRPWALAVESRTVLRPARRVYEFAGAVRGKKNPGDYLSSAVSHASQPMAEIPRYRAPRLGFSIAFSWSGLSGAPAVNGGEPAEPSAVAGRKAVEDLSCFLWLVSAGLVGQD